MDDIKCDYCDHVFTDKEIAEGDRHMALARVELRCPKCFSYNIVSFNDIVEGREDASEEADS